MERHRRPPGDCERYLAIRSTESTNMKNRLVTFVCVVTAIGFVGAFAYALNSPASHTDLVLAPFEFRREAAPTPEVAAQSLFLGVATASPRDFVPHLLWVSAITKLMCFRILPRQCMSHSSVTMTKHSPITRCVKSSTYLGLRQHD